jgi:hypothetical protein
MEIEEARQTDRNRAKQARLKAWVDWEEHVVRELAEAHPVERLVRVASIPGDEQLRVSAGGRFPGLGPNVRDFLPELWHGDMWKAPAWDHDAIHTWLLSAAKTPPARKMVTYLKKRPLRIADQWKRTPVDGWTFHEGSTNIAWGAMHASLVTLVDGRRADVSHADGGCAPTEEHQPGFNVRALRAMMKLGGLDELPSPPGESPPSSY